MWKQKPKNVLVAIFLFTLIAIVLMVVFFKKESYSPHVDEPEDMAAEKPDSKLDLEEATREQLVIQQEKRTGSQPKQGYVINSINMKLVYIPAGSFMMGSSDTAEQLAREYKSSEWVLKCEFPQHKVRISEGFWMGQTEVTQGQYKSVMNTEPWSGKFYIQEDDDNPAIYISWDDAVAFCNKLSQQEGNTYRLPTEAEWEYACRAGTTTRFSFGDSASSLGDYAWCYSNTVEVDQGYVHPVGKKKPNPWGLYDMHGNVWEWCSDFYNEDYYINSPSVDPAGPSSGVSRSLRGGSWDDVELPLRSAYRHGFIPVVRLNYLGFRVVRFQS